MPLISDSPFKRGSAEDFTYGVAEDAQERNAGSGEATMAVSLGLAHVLRAVFKIPRLVFYSLRLVFRSLRWVLASGTVARWTVVAALIASGLGLMLSLSRHDEIMRAQVRIVPMGAVLGFALGMMRRNFPQDRLRKS
jgi:hypothetical protein